MKQKELEQRHASLERFSAPGLIGLGGSYQGDESRCGDCGEGAPSVCLRCGRYTCAECVDALLDYFIEAKVLLAAALDKVPRD